MMLHHLARLEMMKAEEQGIDLSYEQALNIVIKQVMNMMLHHLARLEMMKAEEQGIDLSYEEAIKVVENSQPKMWLPKIGFVYLQGK